MTSDPVPTVQRETRWHTSKSIAGSHRFVPWVVVDGEHSDEVQNSIKESLFDYLCNTYVGPNKSNKCSTPGLLRGIQMVA